MMYYIQKLLDYIGVHKRNKEVDETMIKIGDHVELTYEEFIKDGKMKELRERLRGCIFVVADIVEDRYILNLKPAIYPYGRYTDEYQREPTFPASTTPDLADTYKARLGNIRKVKIHTKLLQNYNRAHFNRDIWVGTSKFSRKFIFNES